MSKAGKNDCQTATSACAGSSKQDANPSAFIFLPQGSCEKIVGGSVPGGIWILIVGGQAPRDHQGSSAPRQFRLGG